MPEMVLSFVFGTFISSNNWVDECLGRYRDDDGEDAEAVVENLDVWAGNRGIKECLSKLRISA